jgi:hypothetical protein
MSATGLSFETVVFHDRYTQVSYTEERDRGEGVAMVRTVIIDGPEKIPVEHQELIEALTAYVDAAQVALRNPAPKIGGAQ